jgi:tetratricopeptide (TPR) repeat protein
MRDNSRTGISAFVTGALFISLSLLLIAGNSVAAEALDRSQAEQLTAQGNQFYQDKQYDKAIDAYQRVIDSGYEGTSVYYNLGDAFYREGKLGYAILYYEKALRLSPGDDDVIHNLKIANARTVDKIDALPRFFIFQWWESLLALFPVTGWAYVAYAFYIIVLCSIGLYFFARRPGVQRYSVYAGFVSVIFLIAAISLLSVKLNRELSVRSGVVVEPTAAVKLSPDPTSNDAFVVHEGLKVSELNSVGGWILIRLQDGKEGWIQQSDIATI